MRGGEENVEGKGCGWRVILDKDVFNDAKEHVGTIEDLIVTRDKGISDAIIGVGVFPGVDATMSPTATISAQSKYAHPPSWCKQRNCQCDASIHLCRQTVLCCGVSMLLQA